MSIRPLKLNFAANLLGLLLAAMLALGGAAPAAAAGTLTVATSRDPGSWDPIDTFLTPWAAVGSNIFEGLTARGPDLVLRPGLAESWQVLDNGTRIRFALRSGVRFHNGEPFDATAVKFTFDRLTDETRQTSPQRGQYALIAEVEIIDELTVDMHLHAPDPVLLTKLAGYGGVIVPPGYLAEVGEAGFATRPVGTGPFRLIAYRPGVDVTLEADPNHWRGPPQLDRIVYRFLPLPEQRLAELAAGRIDIAIDLPPTLFGELATQPGLTAALAPANNLHALFFNTKDGPTADLRVRRAITLGVDRAGIIARLLPDVAEPIVGLQTPLSFGAEPTLAPPPYDPEQARALLAEAGIAPGTPLRLDLLADDPSFQSVAEAVAADLTALGFAVDLQPHPISELFDDLIANGETGALYQMSWGAWTFDFDHTAYPLLHTREFYNPYNGDAERDALLERQRQIVSPTERERLLQDIARYVVDEALALELYSLRTVYGLSPRVENFVPPPDGRLLLDQVSVRDRP